MMIMLVAVKQLDIKDIFLQAVQAWISLTSKLSHLGKQFFEWPERPPVKWHQWAFEP